MARLIGALLLLLNLALMLWYFDQVRVMTQELKPDHNNTTHNEREYSNVILNPLPRPSGR